MNKILLAGIMAAGMTLCVSPAVLASDSIYITVADKKRDSMRVDDLKTVSVCALKEMIAKKYKLDPRKFVIKRGSWELDDDKTLYADNVRSSSEITVEAVDSTWQCR